MDYQYDVNIRSDEDFLSEATDNTEAKGYFGKERKILYEDIECSIPEKAELVLQSEYGNYMKLLPEKKEYLNIIQTI